MEAATAVAAEEAAAAARGGGGRRPRRAQTRPGVAAFAAPLGIRLIRLAHARREPQLRAGAA